MLMPPGHTLSLHHTLTEESTREEIVTLLEEELARSNISFSLPDHTHEVRTELYGTHFRVFVLTKDVHFMKGGFYPITSYEVFADMLLSFSMEDVLALPDDDDILTRFVIDNLRDDFKDEMLYHYLKKTVES